MALHLGQMRPVSQARRASVRGVSARGALLCARCVALAVGFGLITGVSVAWRPAFASLDATRRRAPGRLLQGCLRQGLVSRRAATQAEQQQAAENRELLPRMLFERERAEPDLMAPLPEDWPRSQCELWVDVLSVVNVILDRMEEEAKEVGAERNDDPFVKWPFRVALALEYVAKLWGEDTAKPLWAPVMLFHDMPDRNQPNRAAQFEKYADLALEGPNYIFTQPHRRESSKMMACYPMTYTEEYGAGVDGGLCDPTSCDREMVHMLELSTRDTPRKHVVITDSELLQTAARKYATVRSPEWLIDEILDSTSRFGPRRHEYREKIEDILYGRALKDVERNLMLTAGKYMTAVQSQTMPDNRRTTKRVDDSAFDPLQRTRGR